MKKLSVEERFWPKVNPFGPIPEHAKHLGRCWIWTGTHQTRKGKPWYGLMWLNGKNPGAHRVSWMIHRGGCVPGKFICHHCDNPICVNPHHLFEATQKENIGDAVKKGRMRKGPLASDVYIRGSAHPKAILNEIQVKEIKTLYHIKKMKPRHIAKKMNLGIGAIRRVVYEMAWRHIRLD